MLELGPNIRICYASDFIANYLNHKHFYESCSPETLRAYATDLIQAFDLVKFGEFIFQPGQFSEAYKFVPNEPNQSKKTSQASGVQKVLDDELLSICRSAQVKWAPLSAASRNRKAATLKSYLNWMFSQGYTQSDLSNSITAPRVPQKLPHFISIDEAIALISKLQRDAARATEQDIQNPMQSLTLVLLLYGGGLRVSEACKVKWTDFDFNRHILRVLGKGKKERLVALPINVLSHIKSLEHRGSYVFGENELSTRTAYEMVRTSGINAGLIKPLHPHALRHSFATHLLSSGANLRTLQELLGHQTLQATQKYTHLGLDQLAQTLETYHPLEKNKLKS